MACDCGAVGKGLFLYPDYDFTCGTCGKQYVGSSEPPETVK